MLDKRYPMRWCRALFLLGLVFLPRLSVSASSAEASVELHARCLDARCRFSDRRLDVELEIRNTGSEPVVLPLEYYQRRGPTITVLSGYEAFRYEAVPRHAWNVAREVQELLRDEIGREIACEIRLRR
ncbi:hypothetical protein [Stenotrophomonas rhizophila]|uniref:hypothetical protein n=1 Tax=Stenotrophomonas rhizophila TaxID=216778 RepID=UPI0028A9862E|nr:hypothetical protein [Stenotrophomonas rhizophila]